MEKINYMKSIKIAVGSCISILIADKIGLQYSVSAGIITLLSIQDTKKETLLIALKRFISFAVCLITAFIVFEYIGYTVGGFGLFLFLFINLCYILNLTSGISMCSVLATHFLIEKNMGIQLIQNEILLTIIGVSIGILINLYMPSIENLIKERQRVIEDDFKSILNLFSEFILDISNKPDYDRHFTPVKNHIVEAVSMSYDNMNNSLFNDKRYYIQFIEMRKNQYYVLKKIYNEICVLSDVPLQANILSNLFKHIKVSFHEYNNTLELSNQLDEIKSTLDNEPLPTTREEFKNRAVLLQIFYDLEIFIAIKREFVQSLSKRQLQVYWGEK